MKLLKGDTGLYVLLCVVYLSVYPHGLLKLALLIAAFYLSIWIHELGHVVAGTLVGTGVSKVEIGTNKELWRTRLWDVEFVLRTGFGGIVHIGKTAPRLLKVRYFIFILGGPMMNLLAALLVWQQNRVGWSFLTSPDFGSLFMFSNIFSAAQSLVPRMLRIGKVRTASDGRKLTEIPAMGPPELANLLTAVGQREARELIEQRSYEGAISIYERCIKEYPLASGAYIGLSICLMRVVRLDEALRVLEEASKLDVNKKYAALLCNGRAWTYLLKGDTESIAAADELSKEALELDALPAIEHTRACILIEMGHVNEGIVILEGQVILSGLTNREKNEPSTLLYLAYAYCLKGEAVKGLRYVEIVEGYASLLDLNEVRLLKRTKERMSGVCGQFLKDTIN